MFRIFGKSRKCHRKAWTNYAAPHYPKVSVQTWVKSEWYLPNGRLWKWDSRKGLAYKLSLYLYLTRKSHPCTRKLRGSRGRSKWRHTWDVAEWWNASQSTDRHISKGRKLYMITMFEYNFCLNHWLNIMLSRHRTLLQMLR